VCDVHSPQAFFRHGTNGSWLTSFVSEYTTNLLLTTTTRRRSHTIVPHSQSPLLPHCTNCLHQIDIAFNRVINVTIRGPDGADTVVKKTLQDYVGLVISTGETLMFLFFFMRTLCLHPHTIASRLLVSMLLGFARPAPATTRRNPQ
jgi:hypothetical protein